ncbi:MAG: TRAP transporter small permease [Spirochaetales bacterium]|nr:TRAP transporter small permease [Spirochaetales bacterium]
MTGDPESGFVEAAFDIIRRVIYVLALVAGLAVLVMIGVTMTDVVLRIFNIGIVGAYDIVRIAGVIAISCGLPYVTAVKGHIAIEFFYQNLNRAGRIAVDTLFRLSALTLFGLLIYKNIDYGLSLLASGEVMPTTQIPVFWIPFLISFNLVLVLLAVFYHLIRPGKEMIKP